VGEEDGRSSTMNVCCSLLLWSRRRANQRAAKFFVVCVCGVLFF
jgi:hypothetical protein